MSMEFTGERVVPGQVDPDLWNEHFARYALAAQLCSGAKVLDAGCGAGYGSSFLGHSAELTIGFDLAAEAVHHAASEYKATNLRWLQASASHLPFRNQAFDVVVAFEVIEHLANWPQLLEEARRVLAESGVLVVSTPNKAFYAESRQESGPNPYHEHEFEFDEFRQALSQHFSHVQIVLQNHSECVIFDAAGKQAGKAFVERSSSPETANFFVAVCSSKPIDIQPFVYVPSGGNVLKERAEHIRRLEGEVRTKDEWLAQAQATHASLVVLHDEQTQALRQSNTWAEGLKAELETSQSRVVDVQNELEATHKAYETRLDDLIQELETRTAQLQKSTDELSQCVKLLDTAEHTIVERTNWALDLERQLKEAQTQLDGVRSSRWVKVGRMIHLGPELDS